MNFIADKIVFSFNNIRKKASIQVHAKATGDLLFENTIIYPALINSHDHLAGNWYPPAISEEKFANSHIWVKAMKNHPTYLDRNKYWVNDGSFILTSKKEITLCSLGVYKNIFSGVVAVQDHAPRQTQEYYNSFPINVISEFTQCHSLPLGNWWGGASAEEEFALAQGKLPFIVHLGEGVDEITSQEFTDLKARKLLAENTIMIHGIALKDEEIEEISQAGATICWCPTSNENLIGKHLNINSCLKYNANVVIGTDSTLSGNINLLAEMKFSKENFPQVSSLDIFKMVTVNAAKALKLPPEYGSLESSSAELLAIDQILADPFDNLVNAKPENIKLLLHKHKPILGDAKYLDYFDVNPEEYSLYKVGRREKFVIGDFKKLTDYVNSFLDYHKTFPYLPQH
ncbi:amidohydrolase family protein [bacterium]|nr:amidohydrolase family protein [bacterium]